MISVRQIFIVSLLLPLALSAKERLPKAVVAGLRNAHKIVVIELGPIEQADGTVKTFHGFPVRSSVWIDREQMIENMVRKIDLGVTHGKTPAGDCFTPSCGLHAQTENGPVDLLFSFSCHKLECHFNGEKTIYSTGNEAKDDLEVFGDLLRKEKAK